jgi:hypothetical protein
MMGASVRLPKNWALRLAVAERPEADYQSYI